jgi:hypothetical protein
MSLTGIRGVVNMQSTPVTLYDQEGSRQVTAAPYSFGQCHWNVPWCNNAEDFENNHYMTLQYAGNTIAIWQQGNSVPFSWNNQFAQPGDSNYGLIAGVYEGASYDAATDADVVLVIDNRPWAILYRLG